MQTDPPEPNPAVGSGWLTLDDGRKDIVMFNLLLWLGPGRKPFGGGYLAVTPLVEEALKGNAILSIWPEMSAPIRLGKIRDGIVPVLLLQGPTLH